MPAGNRRYSNHPIQIDSRRKHYGEAPSKLALYDDGETFDYEKGEYSWTQLTAAKDASGAWSGTVTPDANGRKWHYSDVKWTFMAAP